MISDDRNVKLEDIFLDTVYISSRKRVITPRASLRSVILMPFENMIW